MKRALSGAGRLVRYLRKRVVVVSCLCVLVVGLAPSGASASSIIAVFEGNSWTSTEKDVIEKAVAEWTSLITISQDLTVTFLFDNLSGSTLAQTGIYLASTGLPTAAFIVFDTDSLILWALAGAQAGFYDALSIAEHELGHALGIAYQSNLLYYDAVTTDSSGTAWVDGYELYASTDYGTMSHLADATDLMYPYISAGVRRSISYADIDILCDVYGYTATAVPLPAPFFMLAAALFGLFGVRKRLGR